jgi:hypothetical protein
MQRLLCRLNNRDLSEPGLASVRTYAELLFLETRNCWPK